MVKSLSEALRLSSECRVVTTGAPPYLILHTNKGEREREGGWVKEGRGGGGEGTRRREGERVRDGRGKGGKRRWTEWGAKGLGS
eukprot:scaffold44324_cov30-Tisochrysis_lutea.AAC.7